MRVGRPMVFALSSLLLILGVPGIASAGGANTYRVQFDSTKAGEPWAFLRIFPHQITVHQGDILNTQLAGTDTPHTATVVNAADAEQWRSVNQCQGCQYETFVPDSAVGGDDNEFVLNPSVAFPSSFTCGSVSSPCSFNGVTVVNSGIAFPNPSDQPSFYVSMDAAPGHYSLLCMLHPGMEIPLLVKPPSRPVPSPSQVAAQTSREALAAATNDGPVADAQAQEVGSQGIGGGRIRWSINAGGFSNNVTANEYVAGGLSVHVGDQVQVTGSGEIHTATAPARSITKVPFIQGQCEVPGPDPAANSPSDCADPSQFRLGVNNRAVVPSANNELRVPGRYVTSGLLPGGVSYTFVAKAPGTYSIICLVHGPEMTTTIAVSA